MRWAPSAEHRLGAWRPFNMWGMLLLRDSGTRDSSALSLLSHAISAVMTAQELHTHCILQVEATYDSETSHQLISFTCFFWSSPELVWSHGLEKKHLLLEESGWWASLQCLARRRQLKSLIKLQPPSVYILTSLYKIVTNYWSFWNKFPRTSPRAKCSHRVGRKCETTFHTLIFLHVRLSQSESLWAGQHVCVHLANLTLLFFCLINTKGSHEGLGFRGEKGFVRFKLIQATLYSVGGFLLWMAHRHVGLRTTRPFSTTSLDSGRADSAPCHRFTSSWVLDNLGEIWRTGTVGLCKIAEWRKVKPRSLPHGAFRHMQTTTLTRSDRTARGPKRG